MGIVRILMHFFVVVACCAIKGFDVLLSGALNP